MDGGLVDVDLPNFPNYEKLQESKFWRATQQDLIRLELAVKQNATLENIPGDLFFAAHSLTSFCAITDLPWFSAWHAEFLVPDPDVPPISHPPIQNQLIEETPQTIVLVDPDFWEELVATYGGGPKIEGNEFKGKLLLQNGDHITLKVVRASSPSKIEAIQIHRHATIPDVLAKIGHDAEDAVVSNFWNWKKREALYFAQPHSERSAARHPTLIHGQYLLVEDSQHQWVSKQNPDIGVLGQVFEDLTLSVADHALEEAGGCPTIAYHILQNTDAKNLVSAPLLHSHLLERVQSASNAAKICSKCGKWSNLYTCTRKCARLPFLPGSSWCSTCIYNSKTRPYDVPPADPNNSPLMRIPQDCLVSILLLLENPDLFQLRAVSKQIYVAMLGYREFQNEIKEQSRLGRARWLANVSRKAKQKSDLHVKILGYATACAAVATLPFASGWLALGAFASVAVGHGVVRDALVDLGTRRGITHDASEKHSLWVADQDAPHCMNCGNEFGLLLRRHHCRSCFKVFCYKCVEWSSTFLSTLSWQCLPCLDAYEKVKDEFRDVVIWEKETFDFAALYREREKEAERHEKAMTDDWVELQVSADALRNSRELRRTAPEDDHQPSDLDLILSAEQEIVDIVPMARTFNPDEDSQHVHHFRTVTFGKPTWCVVCTQFIWGFSGQGKQCTICGSAVHHACAGH